jgi:hypothetical protein
MAQKLEAAMPPALELGGGWTFELAALDPSTGAAIANVNVRNMVATIDSTNDTPITELEVGDYKLVPGPGG